MIYSGVNTTKTLSVELCRQNPDTIYVFGDNMIGKGCAGQAQIRYEKNSFGIPTKRLPSMNSDAFFSDREDETECLRLNLQQLLRLKRSGKKVVFPENGLGTGLAKMEEKSPLLFKRMNDYITKNFGE